MDQAGVLRGMRWVACCGAGLLLLVLLVEMKSSRIGHLELAMNMVSLRREQAMKAHLLAGFQHTLESQKRVDAENAKSYVNDEREQEQSLMLSRLSSLRASLLATFHKSQDESRAKEQKAEHALQAKIETLKHKAIVLDLQKEGLEHEVTKLEAGQQDKPREAPATQTNPVLNQDEANRAHTVKKKQVAIRQASFHDPASKTRSEGKTEVANKATATALSLNEAAIAACDHLGSALLHGGHKISALCKDEAMHIASRKQQQAARRSGLSVEKNKSPTIGRSEHSTKLRLLHKDAVLVESKEEQAHLSELHREEQGIAAGQDDVGAGKLPAYADRAAGLDGAHQSVESASLVDDAYLQHEERALRQAKASLHRYALDQEGELWRSQKANQYWEHKDKELADHRLQEAEGGNEGRGGADDIKDEDGEAGEGYWDRIALPEEFQPEVRHPATTRRPRDERRHQMQGASSLLSKGLGGSIVRPPGREFRWPQLQPEVHFELPPSPASEAGSGPVERDEMKVSAVRERADSLGGGRAAEQPRMADANVEPVDTHGTGLLRALHAVLRSTKAPPSVLAPLVRLQQELQDEHGEQLRSQQNEGERHGSRSHEGEADMVPRTGALHSHDGSAASMSPIGSESGSASTFVLGDDQIGFRDRAAAVSKADMAPRMYARSAYHSSAASVPPVGPESGPSRTLVLGDNQVGFGDRMAAVVDGGSVGMPEYAYKSSGQQTSNADKLERPSVPWDPRHLASGLSFADYTGEGEGLESRSSVVGIGAHMHSYQPATKSQLHAARRLVTKGELMREQDGTAFPPDPPAISSAVAAQRGTSEAISTAGAQAEFNKLALLQQKAATLGYSLQPAATEVNRLRRRAKALGLKLEPLSPAAFAPGARTIMPAQDTSSLSRSSVASAPLSPRVVAPTSAAPTTPPGLVEEITTSPTGGRVHTYHKPSAVTEDQIHQDPIVAGRQAGILGGWLPDWF